MYKLISEISGIVDPYKKVEGIVLERKEGAFWAELYRTNEYGKYVKESEYELKPQKLQFIDSGEEVLSDLTELAVRKFPGFKVFISELLWKYLED